MKKIFLFCVSFAATLTHLSAQFVPTASFSIPANVCAGQSFTINDLSSESPDSWNWTLGGGSPSSATLQSTAISYSTAGQYTITLIASNIFGPSAIFSQTIDVLANPVLNVASATLCSGSSTLLTAGGGVSYTWYPGNLTGASQTLNPLSTLIYTISGSDGFCSSETTVTVDVNPTPILSISNATLCSGTSTLLTASGATNYTWNPGSLTGASQNLGPLTTTHYTIEASIGTCTSSASVSINVTSTPTLVIPNASICAGASTLVTASGATNYTWYPGNLSGASQNLNPFATTIYTVVGSNGSCLSSQTLTVHVSPNPTVSVPNGNLCSGNSTVLAASGASTYTWNPGNLVGSSQNLNPLSTTVYTITGQLGICSQSTTAILSVTTTPTISVSSGSLCSGNSLLLSATGASSYTWNPGNLTGPSQNLSPNATTIYSVTGANGICTHSSNGTLLVAPTPSMSVANASICSGTSTSLSASGASDYTWTPGNLFGPSQNLNPLVSTSYTILGIIGTCTATSSASIHVTPTPTLALTNGTLCIGSSLLKTVSGAANYTWNPGALTGATQTLSPVSTSVYSVTGANGSCTSTISASVSVFSLPTLLGLSSPSSICLGESSTLAAAGGMTYTWTSNDPFFIQNGPIATVSPTISTTYTFAAFDATCVNTSTVFLQVNPNPTIQIVSSPSICSGSSTLLTASGADTFTWSAVGTGASQTLNPLATTVYSITGTYTNTGCNTSTTTTLTVLPNPVIITIPNTAIICPGNTRTLSATGANSYTWNPPGLTGSNVSVSPSIATIYSVTGSDGFCETTNTVLISVYPSPTLNLFNSFSICEGSFVNTTVQGGISYTWNPGNFTTANVTLSPSVTTVYTVTGDNPFGCTSIAHPTIYVSPSPSATLSASSLSVCPGQSLTLSSTVSATSYSWNFTTPGTTTLAVTPTTTTLYYLTAETGTCSVTLATTITTYSSPIVSISGVPSFSICSGTSATLIASGGVSYTWSPGGIPGSTQVVSPQFSSLYTITVSNSQGCTVSATSAIPVAPTPTILTSITPTTVPCAGSSVTLTAVGATNYTWMPGSIIGSVAVVSPTTSTLYQVVGALGTCTSTAGFAVITNTNPILNVSASHYSICSGNSVSLLASGALSFSWMPGNLFGNSVTVSPNANTNYTATGLNASGCVTSTVVNIFVTATPTLYANATPSVICAGEASTIAISGASTYSWAGTSSTSSSMIVTPANTISYLATGINGTCSANVSVTVNVNPLPTLSISNQPGTTICTGNSFTFNSSGADNYIWNPGNISGSSTILSPSITTVYSVSGTYTATGCTHTANVTLTVVPQPSVIVTYPDVICSFMSTTLTASGATGYTWNPGNMTGSTISAIMTGNTNYTINANNFCGTTTSVITLIVIPQPSLSADYSSLICLGESVLITPSGATNYTYEPGNLNGSSIAVSPSGSANYTITGESQGCFSKIENVNITVSLCEAIGEHSSENFFNIYPNPADDKITIDFGRSFSGTISVYTILGNLVSEVKVQQDSKTEIDLNPYLPGFYLLQIPNSNNKRTVMKFLKK